MKKFPNKGWKIVVAIIGALGIIWGVFEAVYRFTDWYHTNEFSRTSMVDRLDNIDSLLLEVINEDRSKDEKIKKLEEYRSYKKQSFAVGFRMFKLVDSETGEIKWIKRYREWSGEWRDVFKDSECTEYIGMDCYFYYNDNGKRIYRSQ